MRFKKTAKNTSEKAEKPRKPAKKSSGKAATGMATKSVIGLEIGPASIRMVQIAGKGSGRVQLEKYAVEPLPQNVVSSSEIVNFDTLVSHLQQCYDKLKTNCKATNVGLPVSMVTIEDSLQYSEVGAEMSLQEFVEAEVVRVGPLDEMNYDWQTFPTGGKEQNVLIIATKTDNVNQFTDLLDDVGLTASNVDVDLFALFNAFAYMDMMQGGELANERIALFDIGDVSLKALIVESGQILYRHEAAFGLDQMIHLIQRNYQVTESEALEMISGRRQRPADYKTEVSDYFNMQIAQEVQRALQFFMTTRSDDSVVQQIFLSGSACVPDSGLAEVVRMSTNTATQHIAPITLAENKIKGGGDLARDADSLTTAFGLALRGLY